MVGKTLNEFIETLCYGGEMEFRYKNREFLIQCETVDGVSTIRLDEFKGSYEKGNFNSITKIIKGESFEDCAKKLIANPFIDDKTLFEIEKEIEVLFG